MAGLASLVLVLVPLLIAPGLMFYYDVTPKAAVVLAGTAAVLPWLVPTHFPRGTVLRRFAILLLLQAGSVIISTVWSVRPELSLAGSDWRRFGLIMQLCLLAFAAVVAAAAASRVRLFLRAIALGGAPVALYGIAQYFGWDPFLRAADYHVGEGVWTIVRPPATLGYVTYFATYELSVLFAGVALWMTESRPAWRAAGVCASVLATAAVVLSGTRAAMLGIAAGVLVQCVWMRPRISARARAVAAAAVVGMAGFYFAPPGQALRSRARWFREDPLGGARLALWRDSLVLGARHPVLGTGPETFAAEFPRVQSAALSRAYPNFHHESPHNMFLDAWTAQGLPGLLLLAALVAFGLQVAWQCRGAQPRLAGALAAALAAGVVSQQFSAFTIPTALYFYAIPALIAALASKPPAAAPSPRLLWAPATLVLLVLGFRLVAADRQLFETRRAFERGRMSNAAAAYARARAYGLNADLWYARSVAAAAPRMPDLLSRLQAYQQALAAATRATVTAGDPANAWYNLAALYAAREDIRRTEQSLRSAIDAAPNWYKPHWMLAQVLAAAGAPAEARAEALRAVDLDGGKDPEVARALERIATHR